MFFVLCTEHHLKQTFQTRGPRTITGLPTTYLLPEKSLAFYLCFTYDSHAKNALKRSHLNEPPFWDGKYPKDMYIIATSFANFFKNSECYHNFLIVIFVLSILSFKGGYFSSEFGSILDLKKLALLATVMYIARYYSTLHVSANNWWTQRQPIGTSKSAKSWVWKFKV